MKVEVTNEPMKLIFNSAKFKSNYPFRNVKINDAMPKNWKLNTFLYKNNFAIIPNKGIESEYTKDE